MPKGRSIHAMSNKTDEEIYIYQPHGSTDKRFNDSTRFYGIGGVHLMTEITGLTREEAEAVLKVLVDIKTKNKSNPTQKR